MDVRKLKIALSKRATLVFIGVVFLFSIVLTPALPSNSAYAQPAPTPTGTQTPEPEEDGVTCAVEKIGWLVCPLMEGAAKMTDYAYQFLADNFLAIEPELLTSDPKAGAGTITAWKEARNLANIMFIIAFVIIIYSQITGSGLNNYGIKRMLPRLVIAAIAVNVSYYICQTIVDFSNILGYNIMEALQTIATRIGDPVMSPDVSSTTGAFNTQSSSGGGVVASITVGVLAAAGLVWLFLPVLGSAIMFILVTCAIIIIVLMLRKALIVLLVVISPLAFVMYLLPNTEKYFSKWLSMFWKLLLVFPIIGLLLGGGQLASTVILAAGSQDPPDPNKPCETSQAADPSNAANISKTEYAIEGECGIPVNVVGPSGGGKQARQASWTTAIVALVVLFGPVVFSIGVLRAAMDAGGVVGGKIGGAVNNLGRGARGKVAKDAAQRKEDIGRRLDMRAAKNEGGFGDLATGGTFRRRGMRRNAIRENRKKELGRSTETYLADQIGEGGTGFARSMARGASDGAAQRVASSAADVAHKREAEEVKAASIHAETLSSGDLNAQLDAAGTTDVDDPRVSAAINELAKRQDFDGLKKAIDKFGSTGNNLASRTLGSSISQNNPGLFTAGQIGDMSRGALGGKTYTQLATKNIADGILSPEKMAEAGPSVLEEASRLSGASGTTAANAKAALMSSVAGVNSDLKLKNKLGRNTSQVGNIGAGLTYTPGPGGTPGTWS